MFDSGAEVNILLYSTALALGLAVRSSVTITMRGVSDKPSHIIGYIPEVPIRIGDVTVYQPFFVLERGSNQCILGRPFKMMTRMARQTLNNKVVRITIFN